MVLQEIIIRSRFLTDLQLGAIVDRSVYSAFIGFKPKAKIKSLEDDYLKEFNTPLKVVNFKNCVLKPAIKFSRITPNLYGVDEDLIKPDKLRWYGYSNFNLNPPAVHYGKWMDAEEQRFVISKEYLHLYAGLYGKNSKKRVKDLIQMARMACKSMIPNQDSDLTEEQSAFYMAMETLIPHKLRQQYDWLATKKNATPLEIATVFMVPDEVVEHYQSETCKSSCTYAGLSHLLNSTVTQADFAKYPPKPWYIPGF